MPDSGADQRTVGGQVDNPHAIELAQVLEKSLDYECLRY